MSFSDFLVSLFFCASAGGRAGVRASGWAGVRRFFSTSGRADEQTNRSVQRHCEEGIARRGNLLRLVRDFHGRYAPSE